MCHLFGILQIAALLKYKSSCIYFNSKEISLLNKTCGFNTAGTVL
jgi:hypothetical protein